jgi:hypothetical protein
MLRSFFLLLVLVALMAAAPADEPEDLIRQANAAFLRGDTEAADSLYAAAQERTGDPGLVAFNMAAVLFQKGEFYAAEVHYARTLDDKACPADRAAKAWFNRGTCLLRRGGGTGIFRSAIACFDRCLDSPAADEPLKADARHNLELAKLLWAEANKKAAKQDNPNERTREEDFPDSSSVPPSGFEPGGANDKGNETTPGKKDGQAVPERKTGQVPRGGADGSKNPVPGDVPNPQPLLDESTPQKLSPEDTREYLRRTEERLRQERRNVPRPPDRPGVRDW